MEHCENKELGFYYSELPDREKGKYHKRPAWTEEDWFTHQGYLTKLARPKHIEEEIRAQAHVRRKQDRYCQKRLKELSRPHTKSTPSEPPPFNSFQVMDWLDYHKLQTEKKNRKLLDIECYAGKRVPFSQLQRYNNLSRPKFLPKSSSAVLERDFCKPIRPVSEKSLNFKSSSRLEEISRPRTTGANCSNRKLDEIGKVKPSALKYKITEHLNNLAKPIFRNIEPPRVLGYINPKALTALPSSRIQQLAQPRVHPTICYCEICRHTLPNQSSSGISRDMNEC